MARLLGVEEDRIVRSAEDVIQGEQARISELQRTIDACSEKISLAAHQRERDISGCHEKLERDQEDCELFLSAKKCAIDETRCAAQRSRQGGATCALMCDPL